MTPPFEDIVIVDLDVQKTTWSRVHSAMRTLYLRLNRDPDIAWNKFFFEERNSRVEVKRHGLWIEDGYIVFDCLLIDVDNHHLPDIRRSIAYANERSRELRQAQAEEREQLKAKARDEAEVLKALRANIREERPTPAAPAVFEVDAAPELDTAHSLEEAAHAQLASAAQSEAAQLEPAEPVISEHERRLHEFYAAFAPKSAPEPQIAPTGSMPEMAEAVPIASDPISQNEAPTAIAPDSAATADTTSIAPQISETAESAPAAPEQPAQSGPAAEPAPAEASELDLEFKRSDWRARFRAAFERNKN